MPILANRKHELIAQALAEGKSQTQAFIAAGSSERGANANSSRMFAQHGDSIQQRVDEILGSRVARIEENHTLEAHLSTLAGLRDEARASLVGSGMRSAQRSTEAARWATTSSGASQAR